MGTHCFLAEPAAQRMKGHLPTIEDAVRFYKARTERQRGKASSRVAARGDVQ